MIKVIVGYRVKRGEDMEAVFLKIRSHAMTFPGYIGSENLQSAKDSSIIAMIQTWETIEDWKAWEPSQIRQSILKEARPLLLEDPRVTEYRVVPTKGWGYAPRES